MTWNYAAKKEIHVHVRDGVEVLRETMYSICEVFHTEDGVFNTTDPIDVFGDTKEDLAHWLRVAAADVENRGVVDNGVFVYKIGDETHHYATIEEYEREKNGV